MKKLTIKFAIMMILSGMIVVSCSKSGSDPTPDSGSLTVNDATPSNSSVAKMGMFVSYAHGLDGTASLYVDGDGMRVLRFENFTMSQGPDVHVYVSKANNFSNANVIEVAKLADGYTKSNVNFKLTSPSYTSDYKYVLVYCVQYNSLFGNAELK